jgi:CHAD domain-containing protein
MALVLPESAMSALPSLGSLLPDDESPETQDDSFAESADVLGDRAPGGSWGPIGLVPDAAAEEAAPDDGPAPEALQETVEHLAVGRTPDVRPDDLWAEAGRMVLRFHLARALARVPGVVAGEDPEDVHAMRVAARRMRAGWRVFGDAFEPDARRRYVGDLREIGTRLGAVRDLDVLLGILTSHAIRRGERAQAGLAPLLRAWSTEREARRAELVGVLESGWFVRFVAEYEAFAGTEGLAALPSAPHVPGLVRTRMPSTAWAAYEAVWAFDDGLREADLATLHQLRIAGKWLRYTLEFVREALEPEGTPLIRTVVALQDHLGDQHDRHVAATLARTFTMGSESLSKHELRSIQRFVRELDEGVEQSGRAFVPTWRSLVAPEYRRRLGRALARL